VKERLAARIHDARFMNSVVSLFIDYGENVVYIPWAPVPLAGTDGSSRTCISLVKPASKLIS
jgi:hypothetical protein